MNINFENSLLRLICAVRPIVLQLRSAALRSRGAPVSARNTSTNGALFV